MSSPPATPPPTKKEAPPHGLMMDTSANLSSSQVEIEAVDDATIRDFYAGAVSDKYRLKSELVAKHLAETGMGKFQWCLFVVNGFGWMVDNFWSQGATATRPPVANEFTDISYLSLSSVAFYVGLIVGASFWGTSSDLIGRKPAFNATILMGGVFACAVAGAQDFVAFCSLWAVVGIAAGGNVPVDSCIFLEFVPQSHKWLLVSMSGWWNLGQLIVSLLAWVFLANFACDEADAPCAIQDNMGWRYLMITLGGLALLFAFIRIFIFKIPESPYYLLSKGRDAEAVESVNYIARYNGTPETLTVSMLESIDQQLDGESSTAEESYDTAAESKGMTYKQMLKESFKDYNSSGYRKLFAGRKMAQHTSVTFLIWLTVGIAYPLYFAFIPSYLQNKSTYAVDTSLDYTYKVYSIVSVVGIVGPIAAGFCVETPLGRRWMMAISAVLTGVFLFAYTSVGTAAADIGFQCATAVLGNFEYAVMYAFTPESFPGTMRGTGTGVSATLLRVGGLVASLISTFGGYTSTPIYVSAALWVLVGLFCIGLPYETHGRAAI